MKQIISGCLFVFGLIGCATLHEVAAPTVVDSSPTTDAIPSPTMDVACWEKEKECEVANSLGFHINEIFSFSPDMQWVVVHGALEIQPEKYVGGLRFVKTDKHSEWLFSSTQMQQDIGECALFWEINFWSADSRYVYFSPDPGYCSRPVNFSAEGTQVLYRLDVQTGEFIDVLPFKFTSFQHPGLYTLQFSHDGNFLAYFQTMDSPVIIKVRELLTGSERSFPLDNKYQEAGCLAWTRDDQDIIFYAAKDTRPGNVITSSLLMIDTGQEAIQTIYSDISNIYCPSNDVYDWEHMPTEEDLIPVSSIGNEPDTKYFWMIERFYLNPFTGERVPWPIPTP